MRQRRTGPSVLLLFTLTSFVLHSQEPWYPVVAKWRRTTSRVYPDGRVEFKEFLEGHYARSSRGGELTYWGPVIGGQTQAPVQGVFRSAETMEVFDVRYGDKTASFRQKYPHSGPVKRDIRPENVVGEKIVNGVPCTGLRILLGSTKRTVGTMWISLAYDLIVKMESDVPDGAGGFTRNVDEKYDIQLGVEPPASAVRLPEDFVFLRPSRPVR